MRSSLRGEDFAGSAMKHLLHGSCFGATVDVRRRKSLFRKDFCAVTSDDPRPPPRRSFFGALGPNELKGLFWQVLVVGVAVAVIVFLWSNTITNLSARRITTGFAFLGREAGMPIADSLLAYNPKDSYLWAFVVGIANTLCVAVIGIVLATILGTVIGISRLSANWLL